MDGHGAGATDSDLSFELLGFSADQLRTPTVRQHAAARSAF
jgi:hypothetical protein